MNCQKFETVVSELARGQMMAAEQRGEALAHSDGCEDCTARLHDEKKLTDGLRSLAREMEALEASAGIETKLLAEFRNRSASVPPRRQVNARYWLSAVAAILLIAIAIVAFRSLDRGSDQDFTKAEPPKPPAVEEVPQPKPENEAVAGNKIQVNEPEPQQKVVPPPRRRSIRPNRPAAAGAANHVRNEIATDFMPLGYMNAASFQDGGQIIRVEVRRSTLANFGVPVNMDRYNEKVKADVLIGVDGLARAIRFVQ